MMLNPIENLKYGLFVKKYMAFIRTRGKTKKSGSGAKYIDYRKAKSYELATLPTLTKMGEQKIKVLRSRAGKTKRRVLEGNKLNLYNPKTKKYSIEMIETVVENPANAQYVRRNIIMKGTIVQTSKGKARITSRPGQTGFLNGVLVE